MKDIYREKRGIENDGSSDDGLDIQGFEIREYNHEKFTKIEQCLIPRAKCHIGHSGDGVTDDINSHNEQNREERGNESREKEDDGEEKKEFQIDESNCCEEEEGKWSFCDQEYPYWYDGLYENDNKKNGRKSKEFSENEISSSNRLREN